MQLIRYKGKTKVLCECGAQVPKMTDEAFAAWKQSQEGREFYSRHRPHGKAGEVERGGKQESIEESLKKIEKKRTKASTAEINELAEYFERRS